MIERTIKTEIIKCLGLKPITLITGARQVGKSTLCYELKKELGFDYVSLDDIRNREQAITDPEYFLSLHKPPLIIDEVQHAPKLFDVIVSIVNKEKLEKGQNAGMYILTGSQTYELMEGVTESMAGRVAIVRMSPLSAREIYGQKENRLSFDFVSMLDRGKDFRLDPRELFRLIVRGGYPELHSSSIDLDAFYSNYVNSYLEKDVSQLINIKDKLRFQNFLQLAASLTGQEIVYSSLSKAIGVKVETIQSWLSVLLAGDLIYLLEPYNEYSIGKRIVKRPKLYFSDTGLACFLARLSEPEVLERSIFAGRFVETYIVNEIRKNYRNNGIKENLYYYRDNNQNEIDLIVLDGGVMHLIECKSGISYTAKDVKSFSCLKQTSYQKGDNFVICNTPSPYKIGEDTYAINVTAI